MDELSQKARDMKDKFLQLRAQSAPYDQLKQAADEYAGAVAAWHKARFPGKRFRKPSVGYLIRAL
jgi:hypothetical protein